MKMIKRKRNKVSTDNGLEMKTTAFISGCFLYIENHALNAWFSGSLNDVIEKTPFDVE